MKTLAEKIAKEVLKRYNARRAIDGQSSTDHLSRQIESLIEVIVEQFNRKTWPRKL